MGSNSMRRSAPDDAQAAVAIRDELAIVLRTNGVEVGKQPRVTEGEELFPTPFPPGLMAECEELLRTAEEFFKQGQDAAAQGDMVAAEYFYKTGSVYLHAWTQSCLIVDG